MFIHICLFLHLDLNRSCVICTSDMLVKISYACKEKEKQITKKTKSTNGCFSHGSGIFSLVLREGFLLLLDK